MFNSFQGCQIIEDHHLMIADGEDWSRVRSPARARRRLKRGFRQNITPKYKPDPKIYGMGNKLIMHPMVAAALRQEVAARNEQRLFNAFESPFSWPR